MDRIEQRKQNWMDFMNLSSTTNRLLVVECSETMPQPPLLWWENEQKRIDWAYERYMRQMEQMEWLDDNAIPFLSILTGTEIFAEAFGCQVHRPLDNKPCAMPFVTNAAEAAKVKVPRLEDTRLVTLFEMADRLRERAGKDALLNFPDVQTPMDILALIWDKSSLFLNLYENPELVKELSAQIKEFLFGFLDLWIQRYGPEMIAHYPDYYMPFGVTVSEDEIGAVSADMYQEFFEPELVEMACRYGAIGVHCCADSQHQWENLKGIPNLKLLNLIRPEDQLLESCAFFGSTTAQFITSDLDISGLEHPERIHLAKYLYLDTKKQALEAVERHKAEAERLRSL